MRSKRLDTKRGKIEFEKCTDIVEVKKQTLTVTYHLMIMGQEIGNSKRASANFCSDAPEYTLTDLNYM